MITLFSWDNPAREKEWGSDFLLFYNPRKAGSEGFEPCGTVWKWHGGGRGNVPCSDKAQVHIDSQCYIPLGWVINNFPTTGIKRLYTEIFRGSHKQKTECICEPNVGSFK